MMLVVNANSTLCRLYHYNKSAKQLTLLKEFEHPEGKLKNQDLVSDKPGHYQADHSARGAYQPPHEATEIEMDNFARNIAHELDHQRLTNSFDKLILIAPPHFYGLLSQHMNKHVKGLVTNCIQKDLLVFSERELLDFLHSNAHYADQ